jgi:hypothetical protein
MRQSQGHCACFLQFLFWLESKRGKIRRVKYWEIADNLSKAGWSWGWASTIESAGRTVWIADAHRGERKRFVLHVDEELTAFMELELAIRAAGLCLSRGLSGANNLLRN